MVIDPDQPVMSGRDNDYNDDDDNYKNDDDDAWQ